MKIVSRIGVIIVILGVVLSGLSCRNRAGTPGAAKGQADGAFVIGMLLVGPYNDHGWSQAHFDAGRYVEKQIDHVRMIYVDKVNPTDRPGTTPSQLAEDLLAKGAKLIVFNSDDMKDGALEFARKHPTVPVIHASGDSAWKDGKDYKGLPNLVNVMGRMEFGEMMAGFVAAMSTRTGKIGFLGPLINDETRRLASSAYLGAKYAWEKVLKRDPKDLVFKVTWIGFWFNLPGITSDPTQVMDDFYNSGFDVVISGIDTSEPLVQAKKQRAAGKMVYAISYDYNKACDEAPDVCLGVPYYNWGPEYVRQVKAVMNGSFKPAFIWNAPSWQDINDADKSAIGFTVGKAMSAETKKNLDAFIAALASSVDLWIGPMAYQDGSEFLKSGEQASETQVWYLPQLLAGMQGQSVSK